MSDQARLRPLADIVELRSDKLSGRKPQDAPYLGLEHIDCDSGHLNGVGAATHSVSTNCVFLRGDILFGKLRPNLRKCVQAPFDGFGSTDILVLRPVDTIDRRFAVWVFQQEAVFRRAEQTAIGTKMPRTSWHDLKQIQVFLPETSTEQRRIAQILDALDTAIRETEALIAKLRKIKAGLLHDLLTRGIDENGELRNPSRVGPQWTDSDIGSVPLGWEVTGLCDRAHPSRPYIKTGPFGSALKSEHWVSEGVPAITIGALGEGEIIRSELLHVTTGKAASLRECAVHDGDLVFSRVADVGRSVLITAASDGWIMSSNLMRISLNPTTVLPEYAYFALVFDDRTRKQVRSLVNAGGRDVANTPILERLKFAWPPLEEQKSIVERANAVDSALRVELDQRSKLTKLKSGLMHDLLTGKVRVPLPGTAR